jgi:nucleotide-binding universal stress UspA family protein
LENNRAILKILLPVDFSENSLNACRYAFLISHYSPVEIVLFHACYSPALDLIELTEGKNVRRKLKNEVQVNLYAQAENELTSFKNKIMCLPEASFYKESDLQTTIKLGTVKENIQTVAQEILPDMVIMGTHGKDNTNSFLGSITEFAIDKLGFPVLAIPSSSFYILSKINSILYITNFNESDFQSIKKLLELTQNLDMRIHCMHIGEGNIERKKLKMEGMIEYFKKAYNKYNIEFQLITVDEKKDIIPSIENYIEKNEISMISITHKQRNMLEKYLRLDLTKNIFNKIHIPLLVFHS